MGDLGTFSKNGRFLAVSVRTAKNGKKVSIGKVAQFNPLFGKMQNISICTHFRPEIRVKHAKNYQNRLKVG